MGEENHSFVCKIGNKILWSKVAQTVGNLQLWTSTMGGFHWEVPASLICTLWTPWKGEASQRIPDGRVQLSDGSNWGRGRQPIGNPFGVWTLIMIITGFNNSV